MQIHRLQSSNAPEFQKLRLFGLRESPTAFGSSYEEEVDRRMPAVAESLADSPNRTTFGAFDGAMLVGIVRVGRETGLKEKHRAFIRSMYVHPIARGKGIGKALIAEAVRYAQSIDGVSQLTLAVTASNLAAIAMYRAAGFEVFGTLREALLVDGNFHDEIHMALYLDSK